MPASLLSCLLLTHGPKKVETFKRPIYNPRVAPEHLSQNLTAGSVMTKRLLLLLATASVLLSVASYDLPVSAKDSWVGVRSRNFYLIGNASEKEVRLVASRLEQFREVFAHLFPRMNFNSPVPTTVIVFKNDSSYGPFKPNAQTAGYFQSGPDVNYITLTTEMRGQQDPFKVIFHEYTHLLVNNTIGNAPLWFNEGLAEYYSTFSVTDDQKVTIGKPIGSHVLLLRENKLLPLRTLFQVDHKSPHYNERNKQSIFYAESWALMHYLIIGKEGRLEQLGKFVQLIDSNVPMEQAFQQAFQINFDAMEKELRDYVRQDRYHVMTGHFERKLGSDNSMEAIPISEAEAQAYLGDLLLHSNRKDCESYLQKALALDPNLGMAHASLGIARLRDGKPDEARADLERAVAANTQNYLVHYYYAYVLSRSGPSESQPVNGYAPEVAAKILEELQKAIKLRPDYPESYHLFAFVSLVTGNNLDEAATLLKRAIASSPGRNDLLFMLGQIYLRNGDYKGARELLEQVTKSNAKDELRQRAQSLLAQLASLEEQKERSEAAKKSGGPFGPETTESQIQKQTQTVNAELAPTTSGAGAAPTDPSSYLREALRAPAAGETRLQGTLIKIECDSKGIVFVVKVVDQLLRLRTKDFESIELTTYDPDVKGEITCGARMPGDPVVVCFVPQTDKRLKIDGLLRSIEFVPKDFHLEP
jgi:FimV-like protein